MILMMGLLAASAMPLRAADLETVFEVRVERGKAGCTVVVDGRRHDLQASADELFALARERRATRSVITTGKATPYRCVEDVVAMLKRGGVADLTIGNGK
jgi:biopolymer transport protein ExbD